MVPFQKRARRDSFYPPDPNVFARKAPERNEG